MFDVCKLRADKLLAYVFNSILSSFNITMSYLVYLLKLFTQIQILKSIYKIYTTSLVTSSQSILNENLMNLISCIIKIPTPTMDSQWSGFM